MTICVSVKVGEGLVLAADSAVMLQGQIEGHGGTQVIQSFESANKVTRVKDYPIGVMTWGIGSISDRSIQSLIMEFEYGFPYQKDNSGFTVQSVAQSLLDFVRERYDEEYEDRSESPGLGLYVGGYSDGEFFPEGYSFVFPASEEWKRVRPNQENGRPSFGVNWFGQHDALTRLVNGYDPESLEKLITDYGVDKEKVEQWLQDNVAELPLVFDGMPLQDAIDFAEYAAQVVIGRFRFGIGPPLCGGAVDIAVITPGAFEWAQRKQWAIKD